MEVDFLCKYSGSKTTYIAVFKMKFQQKVFILTWIFDFLNLEKEEAISKGGQSIIYIRLADDMVILSHNNNTLQRIIERLEGVKEYGIQINVVKIKLMKINNTEKVTIMTGEGKVQLRSSDIFGKYTNRELKC